MVNPKIFISYAHEDYESAQQIYFFLLNNGGTPWIDRKNILPGQNWEYEIQKEIKQTDFFIACLSNSSVSKRGFVQKELKDALKIMEQIPEGEIYLIPVKLEEQIRVPLQISKWQWVKWPEEKQKLLDTLAIKKNELSLLGDILLSGVGRYIKCIPGTLSKGSYKRFDSVSEFWYVGTNIYQDENLKSPKILELEKENVVVTGHLSPFAPVIPSNPTSSLGMEPEIYLELSDEGGGSQIDGMDILWNDQVFLPPGITSSGFYYAGLYNWFGDGDVHIPLFIRKETKNAKEFLDVCKNRHYGCVAEVTGTAFKFEHEKDYNEKIFNYFPELREINKKAIGKNEKLDYSKRELWGIEVKSIELKKDLPSSFIGTLWICQKRLELPGSEKLTGLYVDMGINLVRNKAIKKIEEIYNNDPKLVSMSYDGKAFPTSGNEVVNEEWRHEM